MVHVLQISLQMEHIGFAYDQEHIDYRREHATLPTLAPNKTHSLLRMVTPSSGHGAMDGCMDNL